MFSPSTLAQPIVCAPMAGGPSTPALAAAVSGAGGLGFVAAGYRDPGAVREDIRAVRDATTSPFGVNLFAPPVGAADADAVGGYAGSLGDEERRYATALGSPRHDDDAFAEKVALLEEERVPVVSFTFGCPSSGASRRLRAAGAAVWVTVTTPGEASAAAQVADALVVQGVEAGGHRGSFRDDGGGDVGLLALLQLVSGAVNLPLVASGGIATGRGVAGVLAAGAAAAQLGTAFMLSPEAATPEAQRGALAGAAGTALTRAFTGRTARGLVNRFLREHQDAPSAYPEIHHLTAPLRAAARERGDADGFNLWAGQAYPLAEAEPAGELVRRLGEEARAALREAVRRLD